MFYYRYQQTCKTTCPKRHYFVLQIRFNGSYQPYHVTHKNKLGNAHVYKFN